MAKDMRTEFAELQRETERIKAITNMLGIGPNRTIAPVYKMLGIPLDQHLPFSELEQRTIAYIASLPSVALRWLQKAYPSAEFHVSREQNNAMQVLWTGLPETDSVRNYITSLVMDDRLPNIDWTYQHEDTQPRAERHVPGEQENSRSAWEILGIKPEASPEEIRIAYHHAAQMYHPDKVAGLALEFRELAERRMKEINAAYQELKQQTG